MGKHAEEAVRIFGSRFNCAQAVLCACGGRHGVDREKLLAVSGAFGGGIGSTGRVCGAVTGAVMAIGLEHPRTDPANPVPRQETIRLTRELIAKFEERNGSVECRELLGYDLSDPEASKQARESGVIRTVCPKMVRDAAEILEEILPLEES